MAIHNNNDFSTMSLNNLLIKNSQNIFKFSTPKHFIYLYKK